MSEQDSLPVSVDYSQIGNESLVIPLLDEQLTVTKRVIETGTVRLHKHTEERTETIEVPLTSVQWQVEHVARNEVVAEHPEIRQEGETTVYPVVEERVTVLRELVLIEEVRVTRNTVTTIKTSDHILKREKIFEERVAIDQDTAL